MLKVGDRVKVIQSNRGIASRSMYDKTATVRRVDDYNYGLEFDYNIGGHDLHGYCKGGYGYYVRHFEVVPYTELVTGVLSIGDI